MRRRNHLDPQEARKKKLLLRLGQLKEKLLESDREKQFIQSELAVVKGDHSSVLERTKRTEKRAAGVREELEEREKKLTKLRSQLADCSSTVGPSMNAGIFKFALAEAVKSSLHDLMDTSKDGWGIIGGHFIQISKWSKLSVSLLIWKLA